LLARARPKEEAQPPVEQQVVVLVAAAVGQERGNWRAWV
jgi:hypothetical protein